MSSSPTLAITRGTVILQNGGRIVAARLSGTSRPFPLELPDLLLLSTLFEPARPEAAVRALQEGEAARQLPAMPPASALLERLGQYAQAGLLTAEPSLWATPPSEPACDLSVADDSAPVEAGQRFKLGANFMLEPGAQGYRIYLPRERRWCQLRPALAMLLLSFREGRAVRDVLAETASLGGEDERRQAITCFHEAGLLLPAMERPDRDSVRHAADAPRPDHDAPRRRKARWQDLPADPERIPVYFFPHMENHYPLALGMLFSAIEAFDGGRLLERFQLIPITYMEPRAFLEGPYRKFGPGVWLFSNYMWSVDINLEVSALVKRHHGANLTIHGGPSTPGYRDACEAFFARHESVDLAVHGEGEVTICEVLDQIRRQEGGGPQFHEDGMREVAGVSLRSRQNGSTILHAPRRIRMKQPDRIPSPYAEGIFDVYDGRIDAAIVETNRGCPFACTFCDWGSATNGKVSKLDMDRVRQEIEWTGQHRVPVLWVADANFGMLPRDVEIAGWIAETKRRYGYPREVVVNYTKNATRRLADIIRILGEGGIISQGIISIQTSDEQTLEVINRQNIKTEKYDELIQVFAEQGLPLSTDLMIGLPGITVEAFDRDLQRYMDADVAVKAYPTQLLPNSPMADPGYRARYQIETDENDFLIACYSYTPEELRAMKDIFEVYVACEGYGTLRYVRRYLQWEHGIRGIDFLHAVWNRVRQSPDDFPAITWVLMFFNANKRMPGGWRRFYDEIADFIREHYGIGRDSGLETALTVNELAMPEPGRRYPAEVALEHDFVRWFKARNQQQPVHAEALTDLGPGRITFEDPEHLSLWGVAGEQYDTHQYFWELFSPVSRARSVTLAGEAENSLQSPAAGDAAAG
ncbi:B12-binding domain-containing radical SAM protein [Natronospira bacteriovora]|uniref:Radical SAM protein n=1 Tax=Natronospira bacteriovora TaxID=3069753 RepID=A0ABU0W6C0_9GAMM|nr:radical SAM protein [Natronospira sp. AB-CW4]MDQ2069473.1 radical SAM protein [Natronospira sp. AB-CW4]